MPDSLRDLLVSLDYKIWYYLNAVWHNPVLDAFIPFLRNPWTWAPVYLFLLLFMPANYKRAGWMWCVFFILTFAISDYVSASVIKPYFHRLRPCNNPAFMNTVHLLVNCGSGNSFPSSHASNHFALGIFSALTLQYHVRRVWLIALSWAVLVSYAQIYVGVHYPFDILFGALIGTAAALLTGSAFNRIYLLQKKSPPANH
jgi:membrane-associated phospholipid phosphatase